VTETLTVTIDRDILDLAEGFLRHRRQQTPAARDAVARQDLQTLRRIGHELKGTAGSFGFGQLSAIGTRLEDAAETGNLQRCEKAVEEICDFLDRVAISPT
jgi:HPt (histidine-containing phosphotransfer) domain-containing protein